MSELGLKSKVGVAKLKDVSYLNVSSTLKAPETLGKTPRAKVPALSKKSYIKAINVFFVSQAYLINNTHMTVKTPQASIR